MRRLLVVVAAMVLALLPAPLLHADSSARRTMPDYPNPDLLVEPATLAPLLSDPQVVVLDARLKTEYQAGHIPGALWILRAEWARSFKDVHDPSPWGKRIGDLGIGPDSKVIVYDGGSVIDAARTWWILKYWGVNDVRILNGGFHAWKSASEPVSTATPSVKAVSFPATPVNGRLATKSQLIDSIKSNQWQIVDARSLDEHCGIKNMNNRRAGAMPGSCHLEWVDLVDKKTGRFKTRAELETLFAEAGIDLQRPTAAHCQGGGRSAVMAFAMELMGARDVRNYYASWGEWGNAEDTPIVVPSKPKAM